MNFELTENQKMIRDMVREFAEREIALVATEMDKKEEYPYFETASFNYGVLIRLFPDEKRALEWLKQ